MARNEQEILLRERHKAKGHHHHEKPTTIGASGYHSTNAMSYLSPDSARSARGKSPGKEAAGHNNRVQEPHDLCKDELAPSDTVAYPQVHYLDQHWYLVPISKDDERAKKSGSNLLKSAISTIVGKHDLEDHELVVTSTTRSSHQLESDAKTHHRGQDSSHQLHQDATIPVRTPGSESPHQLCCDPVVEEAKGPVQHDLEAHQPTKLTKIDRQHNLAKDVTVGAGGCAVAKHDIHAHEIVKSHGTGPPHHLKDDGGVATSGKSWTTHALDSDNTVMSSNAGHGSHDLDAHTSTKVVGNKSPLDAFRKH
ncbi:hypothetical protein VFPPC_06499 [Pochonia chlamydosporia 170]|uniref:Uncharacterized protein n=1 Tax=Pochonia chlamydosporia 170 TaxID=1380566 RepID=A0A179FID9_METCM|nr:hypothetical protein VFPPC_06499 [Pochonia chlamydosporia 170]OAQ65395.2 hypothetical protein VFPPC_06499 [Pochonia chlamydosporia 170]